MVERKRRLLCDDRHRQALNICPVDRSHCHSFVESVEVGAARKDSVSGWEMEGMLSDAQRDEQVTPTNLKLLQASEAAQTGAIPNKLRHQCTVA